MKLLTRLFTTPVGGITLLWFGATLIVDHPAWVTWLGKTMSDDIMSAAFQIHRYALLGVAALAKQFNETGGTKATTVEAETRIEPLK